MVSLRAYDNPGYSLSVLDRAISVCNDDFQTIGYTVCDITNTCINLAISVFYESYLSQLPAKSASTCTSRPLSILAKQIYPLSIVTFNHLPEWQRDFAC